MVMKSTGLACLLASTLLVSACGSSSSSSSESFNEMALRGQNLVTKYEDSEVATEAEMPTSGTATYKGVAAFSDVPDVDYILENAEVVSNLTLNANFANGNIDGELNNFRTYENQAGVGSVQLSNGSIDGAGFTADLSGNLSLDGQAAQIDGSMEGAFLGSDADAVIGAIQAEADAGPLGASTIYGVFGAEQN